MTKIMFSPRTVVGTMFESGGSATSLITRIAGNVPGNEWSAASSAGVGMSTQGKFMNFGPDRIGTFPLYLHQMVTNQGDLQRHPNQTSRVLHFHRGNGSLIAHAAFQQHLPGINPVWTMVRNPRSLALPAQALEFDSSRPDESVYTASVGFVNAQAVEYPGSMAGNYNPTHCGAVGTPQTENKIVLNILSSTTANYFRLCYDIYTKASGAKPATQVMLEIDGVSKTLVGWTIYDSVATSLDVVSGDLTKRKDRLVSTKV
jgi:hypothetical protein